MPQDSLRKCLKRIGASPESIRRTMIAAYEAEMNTVIHARGGVMRIGIDPSQVDVSIEDTGPGISDIPQAMREGFSTAPPRARELGFGAGMGFPNIRRNTDEFSVSSTVGCGTQVRFKVLLQQETGEPARQFDPCPHPSGTLPHLPGLPARLPNTSRPHPQRRARHPGSSVRRLRVMYRGLRYRGVRRVARRGAASLFSR